MFDIWKPWQIIQKISTWLESRHHKGQQSVPLSIIWMNWAFMSLWKCCAPIHLLFCLFTLLFDNFPSLFSFLAACQTSLLLCAPLSISVIPHWLFCVHLPHYCIASKTFSLLLSLFWYFKRTGLSYVCVLCLWGVQCISPSALRRDAHMLKYPHHR